MPGQSSRTYQIEHWVHSNLHAYNTELVHFKVGEAEVTLFLPAQTVEADGFCARTTLRSITVQEAEHMAHDILRKVLNALTYTCLLYTSPSPRDRQKSRMPSSA